MAFNTTSYLAGIGSVMIVLSTGFAGGYFFAGPDHNAPPNRLQRLAANTTDAKAGDADIASAEKPQAKPEVAAAVAVPAQAEPTSASTTQSAAVQPPASPAPEPSARQAATAQTAPPPTAQGAAKTPEPAQVMGDRTDSAKPGAEREKADAEHARIAEAKAASKKRTEARKLAEQQRRQHELEVAANAVRHIIHDRDGGEVVVRDAPPQDMVEVDQAESAGPEMRPFGFFGR